MKPPSISGHILDGFTLQIVITSGHPYSGYGPVHHLLEAAGVSPAEPSRRESMSVQGIHDGIIRAHGLDRFEFDAPVPIAPGKIWQDLAVDLVLANLSKEYWGWSDARSSLLLEFWKQFDARVRFVLVYSRPEYAVADMLLSGSYTADCLDEIITHWTRWNVGMLRFFARHPGQCFLVNAAAIKWPAKVIFGVNETLGLRLSDPTDESPISAMGPDSVACALAAGLLDEFPEALDLYLELESSASLDEMPKNSRRACQQEALQSYITSKVLIETAHENLQGSAASAAARQEEIGQLVTKNLQLVEENELLFMQMKQVQEALEQTITVNQALDQAVKAEQERLVTVERARDQAFKAEQERYVAAERVRDQAVKADQERLVAAERARDQARSLAAARTSELERYQTSERTAHFPARGNDEFAEILVDLRRKIDGKNWYAAERDGRWAGPEPVSSIRFPAMGPGTYTLELKVVDAMDPAILREMEVSVCEERVTLTQAGRRYPTVLAGDVVIGQAASEKNWDIRFQFPRLVSPAERGSNDKRQLAIRLCSVRLRALDTNGMAS
jgi:hypothetical protein